VWGFTPLHNACYWGRLEASQILLAHGASSTDNQVNNGQTPFEIARAQGHGGMVTVLEAFIQKLRQ
jgi:ankyrin repeat protein